MIEAHQLTKRYAFSAAHPSRATTDGGVRGLRSLQDTTWKRDPVGSRPATAIAELKQQPGKDLIKYDT